ncbi:MAG TPA: hypothetical protein ENF19_02385, partial [Candidatus Bathyarchaeota archaeon]|nr:hypothetical protein [Candidatus Bathyarchaeota archaeon]
MDTRRTASGGGRGGVRACRTCKLISDEPTCPNCKSSDMSEDYSGLMIVLDPEGSILAE